MMIDRDYVLDFLAQNVDEWFFSNAQKLPEPLDRMGLDLLCEDSQIDVKVGCQYMTDFITEADWLERRSERLSEAKEKSNRSDGSTASEAVIDQTKPNGTGTPVVAMVMHDMIERMEKGIETYGQALRADNGRCPLIDAYQEALDLAIYLKQAIIEKNGKES